MTAPTSYTETTLAIYMHTVLGPVATAMGWELPTLSAGDYENAVHEVEIALGVTDVAGYNDMKKIRALAKREAWQMVVNAMTLAISFSADGASFENNQGYEQALKNLTQAQAECIAQGVGGDGYDVHIDSVRSRHDPYDYPKLPEDYA